MISSFYLVFQVVVLLLPWPLRRIIYKYVFGFRIGKAAYIGRSIFVNLGGLTLDDGASIGSFNIIRNLDLVSVGKNSRIGTFNWIAGNRTYDNHPHFLLFPDRRSELIIGRESAVVARHIIDCADSVFIGDYTTVAGHRSQILTHSIDPFRNIQSCAPVVIGDYCFIGTGVIIIKGTSLPSRSILGAGSVLNRRFDEECALYAGNPAVKVRNVPEDSAYFLRDSGFVS